MDKSPNLRIPLNMSKQISYFLECALNIYHNCFFGGVGGLKPCWRIPALPVAIYYMNFVFPNYFWDNTRHNHFTETVIEVLHISSSHTVTLLPTFLQSSGKIEKTEILRSNQQHSQLHSNSHGLTIALMTTSLILGVHWIVPFELVTGQV